MLHFLVDIFSEMYWFNSVVIVWLYVVLSLLLQQYNISHCLFAVNTFAISIIFIYNLLTLPVPTLISPLFRKYCYFLFYNV